MVRYLKHAYVRYRVRGRRLCRARRKTPSKKSVQFAERPIVLGEPAKKRRCKKDPPDGGWSWIVLLGIFVVNVRSRQCCQLYGQTYKRR